MKKTRVVSLNLYKKQCKSIMKNTWSIPARLRVKNNGEKYFENILWKCSHWITNVHLNEQFEGWGGGRNKRIDGLNKRTRLRRTMTSKKINSEARSLVNCRSKLRKSQGKSDRRTFMHDDKRRKSTVLAMKFSVRCACETANLPDRWRRF